MSFVSAQSLFDKLGLKNNFGLFFENLFSNEGGLALKVLFSFLVFLVISAILPFVPLFGKRDDGKSRSPFLRFLISVTVTLLSTMFIPEDILRIMVNPYTALGTVILGVLPFILMFAFVHSTIKNSFLKHAAWIMYGLVLLAVSINSMLDEPISRFDDLDSSTLAIIETQRIVYAWFYGIATFIAFMMVFIGEFIEHAIWAGVVESGKEEMKKYIATRRLQLKYDKMRADAELGITS